MATCENCWADAFKRVYLRGGSQVDHYRALLEERKDNPCPQPPTTGHEDGDGPDSLLGTPPVEDHPNCPEHLRG